MFLSRDRISNVTVTVTPFIEHPSSTESVLLRFFVYLYFIPAVSVDQNKIQEVVRIF